MSGYSRDGKQQRVKRDTLGRSLAPGVRVAFNYSGDVATGTIEHITTGGEFHIRRDSGFRGSNPISKVKRSDSVLVIFEGTKEDVIAKYVEMADMRADTKMELLKVKNAEALDRVKTKLTALIEVVAGAWDLDEVKMYIEDIYGADALDNDSEMQYGDIEKVLTDGS